MRRGPLLLAASFGAEASEARLPEGTWRTLLDSGAAEMEGDRLRFRGRGAVVLEHG
jgi:hypothetical protein